MKHKNIFRIAAILLLLTFLPLPRVAAGTLPETPSEILAIYRGAIERARTERPGYTRSNWQTMSDLHISDSSTVNKALKVITDQYLSPEGGQQQETAAAGSNKAATRLPACTLTDETKIVSAVCERNANGNYALQLVLTDENTPANSEVSFLAQIADIVRFQNEMNVALKATGAILSADYSVLYRDFTIDCELSPDGRLVYLQHTVDVVVNVRGMTLLVVPIEDKSAEFYTNAAWFAFDYDDVPSPLPGDVNGDKNVTAEDARLALRAAVGLEMYLPGFAAFFAADYNKDDAITAADARAILRAAVGLEAQDGDTPPLPAQPDAETAALAEEYRAALEKTRAATPGYTRLTWQKVPTLNLTGVAALDAAVNNEIIARINTLDHPEGATFERGAEEAAGQLPPFALTDISRIVSATKTEEEGVDTVTLVLAEETDPENGESFLGQVTNNIVFRGDIDREVAAISAIPEAPDFHVTYKNLTLTAEIQPDGTLKELRHHVSAEISVNRVQILGVSLNNKLVTVESDIRYYDFRY